MTTRDTAAHPSPFGGDWALFRPNPDVDLSAIQFYAKVVLNPEHPPEAHLAEYASVAYELSELLYAEAHRLRQVAKTLAFESTRPSSGDLPS